MKRTSLLLIFGYLLIALALVACSPSGGEEEAATDSGGGDTAVQSDTVDEIPDSSGGSQTVVIGFTASQTGSQNVSSTRQVNGLNLWMDQVNAAGGIELSDGTLVTFEAVTYDDESNTDRVQELYTRLATEDEADFLISPYSSGLTAASAVIAEQYRKVMLTTGSATYYTYK